MTTYFQEMWQRVLQGDTQTIWFWAALYTFIACSYSLIFQLRTRKWHVTQGDLIKKGLTTFGATERVTSRQKYVSEALYRYNVSGVAYEGTKISPWVFVASHNARYVLKKQMSSIQRHSNGKVKVYYSPGNPKKSYLIVAGKGGIFITFLISILPAILYFFKYHL